MKFIAILLLLAASLNASTDYISHNNSIQILMAARAADSAEYCYQVGVCVEDKPALDPHFASLRVGMCTKRVWYFESTQVVLPCFANFVDKISSQPLSHMNRAWQGVRLYNNGSTTEGKRIILDNIAYPVPIGSSGVQVPSKQIIVN